MSGGYRVVALPTAAEVTEGDDLAALVLAAAGDAGVTLRDGDVLCVASKVVAKAEGATTPLPEGDVDAARRSLAREQATRVVADTPWVLVVETTHGFVCANAGIDTSNVPDGLALLLPDDPDDSARRLRAVLAERTGVELGVVVTDTFGRPWRMGQTDVALGAAGVLALRDDRGTTDRDGRPLAVTMVAVADQLAAAADLARGKADGAPFVLVRGLDVTGSGDAAQLVRPSAEDVFRHGGPTAALAALADVTPPVRRPAPGANDGGHVLQPPPVPPAAPLHEALPTAARHAATALDPHAAASVHGEELHLTGLPLARGAAVHAVLVAAAALGLRVELAEDGLRTTVRVLPAATDGER